MIIKKDLFKLVDIEVTVWVSEFTDISRPHVIFFVCNLTGSKSMIQILINCYILYVQ